MEKSGADVQIGPLAPVSFLRGNIVEHYKAIKQCVYFFFIRMIPKDSTANDCVKFFNNLFLVI